MIKAFLTGLSGFVLIVGVLTLGAGTEDLIEEFDTVLAIKLGIGSLLTGAAALYLTLAYRPSARRAKLTELEGFKDAVIEHRLSKVVIPPYDPDAEHHPTPRS
ncbi:hypothetical protein SAMN04488515_3579 [Cognatiyoonia koreensis]|uniref:Uncharacterized protein n=1 Tax=Cognatiyoonia koreensis TaxID=364200 RepID=A0A1I0RZQ0_9RHOB|nr:hypothetical protein [Cognatiyoonia koreensis]SEW47292.1 hypothetical protein SAMN04488515_3579 [Cognatiyoonia koreensis]